MTSSAATILIVDDELQNRKLLEALLRPEGYLTASATNGEEALALIAERPPDLILLDIMMPGMDGYQVARTLKANPATSSIPIIMVTAQSDHSARLAGLNAGAEDFLTKPVDRAELWLRVRNLLRLKEFSSFLQNHALILEQQVLARTADLRESERRFSDMLGNVELVSVMLDREARITYCNDFLLRLAGWRREEVIGRDWFELFIPSGRDDVKEAFSALLADLPTASHYENEIVTRSGGQRLIQWNNTVLRSAAGEAIGIASIGDDITERKEAEKELLARELRYRAVVTSAPNAFVTSDDDGRIVGWNPSAERIFGYAETEVIGQPLTLLIPQRYQDRHLGGIKRVQSDGERRVIGKTIELTGRRKDSSEFPLELSLSEWSVGEGRFFNGIIRDITERKVAEAKIQRLSQLYAALSQCNEAIVRCASEEELFPQICRAAVQFGGMKMAWIGFTDPDTRLLRSAGSFGDGAEELQDIEISLDADSPLGRGPTGTAIREDQPFWCQDFLNEPITAPWRERAARHGWAASASLPLHRNGVVIGAFILYYGEANVFDEAARHLLVEMAADMNFALDNFAHESQRKRAEEELARECYRNQVFLRNASDGVHILDADGNVLEVSHSFCKTLGYSREELIGANVSLWNAQWSKQELKQLIAEQIAKGGRSVLETRHRRRDGSVLDVEVTGQGLELDGEPVLFNAARDITQRKTSEEKIRRYVEQLKTAFMSTVEVATNISGMRDPYTAGHARRVAEIAVGIGAELGFDARRQEGLQVAGHLHDIGKITIPSEILSKPGKISAIEFRMIQGHAQAGCDVLKGVEFPWPVAEVALQHHERVDGSGYPQGLKGDAILLEARIMAAADVVEAMSSHRPYRAALGIKAALAEIERGRGSAYDPVVADACLKLFREKGYALPV